mgnify:CR=1 FL=1
MNTKHSKDRICVAEFVDNEQADPVTSETKGDSLVLQVNNFLAKQDYNYFNLIDIKYTGIADTTGALIIYSISKDVSK